MKFIQRKTYLDRLINVRNTADIKVITGIRRSGKSVLLKDYMAWLRSNDNKANIIHIDFNLPIWDNLLEYHALYAYVEEKYADGHNNYVCIDEVQNCKDFEKAVNGLHALMKYDIYVTGSNAFLLSGDLATLFTGRTFEVMVYPFSFVEYCDYYAPENTQKAFDAYVRHGGMAGSYVYQSEKERYRYVTSIFNALIVRDIQTKHHIRNRERLIKLSEFLMDNISNLTSSRTLTDKLIAAKDNADHKSVGKYMEYLCNAFLFYKIRRYDIRGKMYLDTQDKYYLADHAFRYAALGTRNLDYGRVYENIVAMELMRRGYDIYVGKLYRKEIDFVAMRQSEQIYIQVSGDIGAPKTFEREVTPLLQIRDAYPKMLIARTQSAEYQYEGIKVIDIAQWLLDK